MKALVIGFALSAAGCASAGALSPFVPVVEFPAAERLAGVHARIDGAGARIEGREIAVQHGARLDAFAEIYAYGRRIAILAPGQTAFDVRRTELLNPEIPVLAKFVDRQGRLVGFAANVFQLHRGSPSGELWIIREEDIRRPDGTRMPHSYGEIPAHPFPPTDLAVRKVEFPRKWWNSTLGVQIANNSHYTLAVRTSLDVIPLPPGEVMYLEFKLLPTTPYGERTVGLTLLDGNRLVWTDAVRLSASQGSVRGGQIIVGPRGQGWW